MCSDGNSRWMIEQIDRLASENEDLKCENRVLRANLEKCKSEPALAGEHTT